MGFYSERFTLFLQNRYRRWRVPTGGSLEQLHSRPRWTAIGLVILCIVPVLPTAGAAYFRLDDPTTSDPVGTTLDGAPPGECLDPVTTLVYRCSDPTVVIGQSPIQGYAVGQAEGNLAYPDCAAQGAAAGTQWCAIFDFQLVTTRGKLTVNYDVTDYCPGHWDGVLVYHNSITAQPVVQADPRSQASYCGLNSIGAIRASVTVIDDWTGAIAYHHESWAGYTVQGYIPIFSVGCRYVRCGWEAMTGP